ncbi:hypothetical protein Vau01_110900 [Virgisporangium aurantiacum]|uniref:non-specific serine/threonine protein kinase n=2 Tax=Virgisporangium aurantiacum TaxID=175570 RepID=A0A8J3ZG99_9ACTN|nr:hypothetical protein Vau01_110900 [Virgisporangium aurantiacum]
MALDVEGHARWFGAGGRSDWSPIRVTVWLRMKGVPFRDAFGVKFMADPGDLIVNRYRLLGVIGSGSMGRVWLARDEILQRDVALKEIVAPYWMPDAEQAKLRGHAVREARIAARLSHRHVVTVFDVLHDLGRPWIVMEYVPSRSLDAVLDESGPMAPDAAAELGLSLLSALVAAHRAGVLHRDVKPQNVLIGTDGRVVLTDFGVAVFKDAVTSTRTDMVIGTPQYVAPERARHGVSTAAADLWSLGATLYAAVEGRPPYSRDTAMDILAAVADDDPDPMLLAGPLRPAIAGLLQRDPAKRANATDAARMLRAAGVAFRIMSPTAEPVVGPAPTVAEPVQRPRLAALGRTRNRIVVAALGAALVATVGVSAFAGSRPSTEATFKPGGATASEAASCPVASSGPSDDVVPGPTALPTGWRWYTDPTGFQVGVPIGWIRGTEGGVGGAVCFRDPDGGRSLRIAPAAPTADPVGYWRNEEQQMADRNGYRGIGIEPVIYQRGGADWTFTWTSGDGHREQTLRRLFIASTGAGFTFAWTTRDYEWALNEPNLRTVAVSFTAR